MPVEDGTHLQTLAHRIRKNQTDLDVQYGKVQTEMHQLLAMLGVVV